MAESMIASTINDENDDEDMNYGVSTESGNEKPNTFITPETAAAIHQMNLNRKSKA